MSGRSDQPITVLIVDDERMTREGLIENLPWTDLGMRVVGSAVDGAAAERLVEQCRPDLVITDVRMPRRDGIAFASSVRSRFPDTEVLFLSGYSDREYLMSAIQLRAFAYVEKPIAVREMTETLRNIARTIRQRFSEQSIARSHAVSFLLERPSEERIRQYCELARVSLLGPVSLTAAVARFSTAPDERAKGELLTRLCDLPADLVLGEFIQDELSIVIGGTSAQEVAESICTMAAEAGTDGAVAIGLGTAVETPERFADSLARARDALGEVFYKGWGAVYRYREGRDRVCSRDDLRVDEIRDALVSGNSRTAVETLRRRVDLIRTRWGTPESVVRDFFARVITEATRSAAAQGLCDGDDADGVMRCALDDCALLSALFERTVAMIEGLYSQASGFGRTRRLVYEVMRYVRGSSSTVPALSEAAAEFRVSAPHLSRTFHVETGERFTDFVRRVKVGQAEVLLKDVSIRISEIADRLGYADRRYFTKVFRSVTGLTPTEYREKNL